MGRSRLLNYVRAHLLWPAQDKLSRFIKKRRRRRQFRSALKKSVGKTIATPDTITRNPKVEYLLRRLAQISTLALILLVICSLIFSFVFIIPKFSQNLQSESNSNLCVVEDDLVCPPYELTVYDAQYDISAYLGHNGQDVDIRQVGVIDTTPIPVTVTSNVAEVNMCGRILAPNNSVMYTDIFHFSYVAKEQKWTVWSLDLGFSCPYGPYSFYDNNP